MKKAFTSTRVLTGATGLLSVLLFTGGVNAQKPEKPVTKSAVPSKKSSEKPCHTLLTPRQIRWVKEAAFPTLEFAYLQGNPTKPGPYTMRVKIPRNNTMPAHFHPEDEVGTVLSGTFYTGAGSVIDKRKVQALPAGSIGIIPKGCIHFAWTKSETIVQVHGQGPWEMQLVDEQGKPKGNPLRLIGPQAK